MVGRNHVYVGLVVLVGTACATGGRNPLDEREMRLAQDHVVEVTNRSWEGMHIYAAQGSATYRLGTVGVNQTESFRLPAAFAGRIGGIQLVARARSGTVVHRSEVILLAPGQSLGWSLESNLRLSFHWIR